MMAMEQCTWTRRCARLDIIVKRLIDKTPFDFLFLAYATTSCVFEKLDIGQKKSETQMRAVWSATLSFFSGQDVSSSQKPVDYYNYGNHQQYMYQFA